MKANIMKIIITATALLFLGAGISLAGDWKGGGYHKPPGNAYGHYKWDGGHPGWNKEHYRRYYDCDESRYHNRNYNYSNHYPSRSGFAFGFAISDPNIAVVFGAKGY
jgi:hypothetical protein